MDSFYTIVLAIAVVCLILILIVFALIIRKANKNKLFPPTSSDCPDYWTSDLQGNCIINGTTNVGTLVKSGSVYTMNGPAGATGTNSIKTNAPAWSNFMGASVDVCGKKNWANANQISWDGVANYNGC